MNDYKKLKSIARDVRKEILLMSFRNNSAHVGGSLSCVEILVSLYFKILKVFPKKPYHRGRDRLIFSKAHDAKALYAVLALRGFFPLKTLLEFEQDGSTLAEHSTRHSIPGIEASAGSLGHGLSIASGIAFAGKLDNQKYKVYAVLSDGECDEGSTWEAILFAGHHRLSNLVAVIDYNKLQGFGYTKEILDLEPFVQKWQSFNWVVREIDGHDFHQIIEVLQATPFTKNKPSVVIAHTIKGLGGVKKHVNQVSSQYKPPTQEEIDIVLQELEGNI